MEFKYLIKETPNEQSLKFIVNRDIKLSGSANFSSQSQTTNCPLAEKLFDLGYIKSMYFFRNYITITKEQNIEWEEKIQQDIIEVIRCNIDDHQADFEIEKEIKTVPSKWQYLDEILEKHIRPGLRADGGDIEIIDWNEQQSKLQISYLGACTSCPTASYGTLNAIQSILKDELKKDVDVEII